MATGAMRASVRRQHRVEDEAPAQVAPGTGPSRTTPKSTKVTPLSTPATSSLNRLSSSGSRRSTIRNATPATKAAMKPEPPRPVAAPYASAAPAAGITCRHGARDQVAAAGLDDDHPDQRARRRARQQAIADPSVHDRDRAVTLGDVGLHVGGGHGQEEQRDADPVVEPALDVQPLADALRHVRVGDDRLPQRCVRRRQRDPEDDRFLNAELAEQDRRDGAPQ